MGNPHSADIYLGEYREYPIRGRELKIACGTPLDPNEERERNMWMDLRETCNGHGDDRSIDMVVDERRLEVPYGITEIQTEAFGQEPISSWLFGNCARDYGLFLKERKVEKISLILRGKDYVDRGTYPFATQLQIKSITHNSDLHACDFTKASFRGIRGEFDEPVRPVGNNKKTRRFGRVIMDYFISLSDKLAGR